MRYQDHPFALGLLCGAALGAAVGLLLAPKRGADLRHDMSDSAQRFRRRAVEAASHASQAVTDVVARGRRAVQVGAETYRQTTADLKQGAQKLRDAGTPSTMS